MEKMVGDLQAAEIEIDEEVINLDQAEFGLPRAPAGSWGSCVRIIDPVTVSFPYLDSAKLSWS
jgi:splicing factor 3B subunit 3